MAASKPKFGVILALLLLLCQPTGTVSQTEGIESIDQHSLQPSQDAQATTDAVSSRELFWVSNEELPAWHDFKAQLLVIQRRRRQRRRRRRFRNNSHQRGTPLRWTGHGFRMNRNMMNMGMNTGSMTVVGGKMMKPRKMRMTYGPGKADATTEQKRRMAFTWKELAERRRNMRMRANRRWKRRQQRMRQRRQSWKNQQAQSSLVSESPDIDLSGPNRRNFTSGGDA